MNSSEKVRCKGSRLEWELRFPTARFRTATGLVKLSPLVFAAMLLLTAAHSVQAQTETVLHSFTGGPDGAYPLAGLALDTKGNLYGTTWAGGARGLGSVIEYTSAGLEKVLYSFQGSVDGDNPYAGVVIGKGALYGTTEAGGGAGCGTVFKVTLAGKGTVPHVFSNAPDGCQPIGGVVFDKAGNLYGTTQIGGTSGNGVVFKITPSGTETVLYSFKGGTDGSSPHASLILDKLGNLYGTTTQGGVSGMGTVFKLTPAGVESVLYTFPGGVKGSSPIGALVFDKKGNLYGTTVAGGASGGIVFKLTPTGTETVLHSFAGSGDGSQPSGSLVFDKAGNLYGMTQFGGATGHGAIFKVTPTGTETVVYSFAAGADGNGPRYGSLVLDTLGGFYGTTAFGGSASVGTLFRLGP
jgi:uncharacterized repeat protein (TIGR03803 family)